MRIVFFSHYFPPEGNAPASRTYDHCVRWVRAGHQVTVVTCAPNVPNGVVYDGYRNRLWPQRETHDGIEVVRVWTYLAANPGGTKRILNFVSYMISALFAFLFWCRRPQVIVATSPQFFCGWAGVIASYLKWCPFVLEIRDIWPESIVTVGAMKKGPAIRVLEVLERWMYRSANHIVAVGEGYKEKICDRVDIPDRITVITNGVDPDVFPEQASDGGFLESYGLRDKFVCSYVGTIGMAHGLDIVVCAADKLRQAGRQDIHFLLVGDGAHREGLAKSVAEKELSAWVTLTGRLAKEDMPKTLASSDAIFVHLKRCDLFQTVIPSKIFEAMAMSRPIIMGVKGESADIVSRSQSGILIEPDDEDGLVEAVTRLADHPQERRRLQENGRPFVTANYSRDVLARQMLEVLQRVARPTRHSPATSATQRQTEST